jgi:hypothetical protein
MRRQGAFVPPEYPFEERPGDTFHRATTEDRGIVSAHGIVAREIIDSAVSPGFAEPTSKSEGRSEELAEPVQVSGHSV